MEPKELSPALLQPQVTVVAIVGELLATLPSLDEMNLLVSALRLYWDLDEFTWEFRVTLYCITETSGCHNVTSDDDDDDSTTYLSQGLAKYRNTPWTSPYDLRKADDLIKAASIWQMGLFLLVDLWAKLARKATKLHHTCRVVANKVTDMAATTTDRARELQVEASCDGTAQENMVELGQALGGEEGAEVVAGTEAQVRRYAMEAASEARRVRQRLEVALGLLERLVAACDEATAFPRELQRLLRDTEAAVKRTNEASPNVPLCEEGLVAKVAVAERLWEANARLVKDHLLGTLQDIIKFYFTGCPTSPGACEVAERCQRAMEDIPRLFRHPECHQGVPNVSPVSVELQELSLALLRPQVTMVAAPGEMMAILSNLDKEMLIVSPGCLYGDLEEFTMELRATLYGIGDTWRCHTVTSDDDDPVTSLSQALAAYESTPWTTWEDVTMAARKWQQSVSVLVNRWVKLALTATELRDTCRDLATKAADRVALYTARARELQDKAARYGTAQENMVELGQALGGKEGAEGVARREAQVRRQAREAASWAPRVTKVRQRVEAALGLLERLVTVCDKATAFPRELQCRVGDIKDALEGTNEVSPDVPEDLEAKVAVAEQL